MMKVKIKQTFRDKENYSLVYAVGEEREFGKSRAQHLIALGLVEPIVDVKEEKKEPIVETQQEQEKVVAETKQEKEEPIVETKQEETQQEKVQQEEVQQEQAELFAEEENQGKNRKQNKQ